MEEYEEYYGIAYQYTDDFEEEGHAWCPCYDYDQLNGYEYAYEAEWDAPADRNLDRRKKSKKGKKHH